MKKKSRPKQPKIQVVTPQGSPVSEEKKDMRIGAITRFNKKAKGVC